MKLRKYIRKITAGLLLSFFICSYFLMGQTLSKQLEEYFQGTFRFDTVLWAKIIYGFIGAIFIRVGCLFHSKKPKC